MDTKTPVFQEKYKYGLKEDENMDEDTPMDSNRALLTQNREEDSKPPQQAKKALENTLKHISSVEPRRSNGSPDKSSR